MKIPRASGSIAAGALLALALVFVVTNGCHGIRNAPTAMASFSEPNTITYIGHATVLLRLNGVTVLTDPVFSEYVGIYRRYVQPGMAIADLPVLDVILLSHGHWDHLDRPTLRQLDKAAAVVVPAGLDEALRALGFPDVRGLRPWERTTVRGLEITAVPAKHWGTRGGYLIRNGAVVYFAGDTGLFDGMRAIGDSQPIDLALLPIGAYHPHLWFIPGVSRAMRRVHMAPEDLPAAAAMLRAKLIVPIHWGTFKLTGEPIDEPLTRLRRVVADRGLEDRVRVVSHGESLVF